MTTNKSRLKRLESQSGAKKFYLCVIRKWEGGGFEAKPTEGEPLYFATRKELEDFGARRDVDLLVIDIVRATDALAGNCGVTAK